MCIRDSLYSNRCAYRSMASGLGDLFYHTLISFLCGGLPEKRYGMVCLSRSYYDDIPASWHIQKSLASGLAAVFNGSRILRHCRLHQDAERKTAAGWRILINLSLIHIFRGGTIRKGKVMDDIRKFPGRFPEEPYRNEDKGRNMPEYRGGQKSYREYGGKGIQDEWRNMGGNMDYGCPFGRCV